MVKKYRNLARKKPYQRSPKKTDDDVVFLKQVPLHPRGRLARKTKADVKFVKRYLFVREKDSDKKEKVLPLTITII